MVMSIGTSPNPLIRSTTPGLETNSHGCIITNGDDDSLTDAQARILRQAAMP